MSIETDQTSHIQDALEMQSRRWEQQIGRPLTYAERHGKTPPEVLAAEAETHAAQQAEVAAHLAQTVQLASDASGEGARYAADSNWGSGTTSSKEHPHPEQISASKNRQLDALSTFHDEVNNYGMGDL